MRIQLVFFFAVVFLLFASCNNKQSGISSETSTTDPIMEQFKVEVIDSIAHTIIDTNASFEILARGFSWSEGPLWIDDLQSLVFSDVPANKIYIWNEKDSLSIYLNSAGHTGEVNKNSGRGSNGLLLDQQNKLIICQHGDRQISRLDSDLYDPKSQFTTIADTYNGMRFNSPNDLTMDRAGNIYFTDPPYGLPDNETGEIGINGVYKVTPQRDVFLLIDTLSMPNGIALSKDEKSLYINQSDPENTVLYRYNITVDGSLVDGEILFDFQKFSKGGSGLPDGLKTHKSGNLFATGPGGVYVISPEGECLALIKTGKSTSNIAFDTDQKYLYTTTTDLLMRVRLK